LAEDERKLASFIRKALREAGFATDEVHDGADALDHALHTTYDTVILDVMLPTQDGLSVLRQLREARVETPVMILTARGEVSQRIAGLEMGADDYMSKPFSMRELLARVAALTRRAAPTRAAILQVADLTMNVLTREVSRGGRKIALAQREFALLEFLMRAPEEVHSRTRLCEHVWEHHFDTGTNVVDAFVNRLRKKIDEGEPVKLLQTERGIGYVLRQPM
jgi:DNA-binding response OmpR family regulator